jgi:ribosomal protein L11 methyltransferase
MSKTIPNQQTYFVFNIPQKDLNDSDLGNINDWAFECGSTGIEEFSLDEQTVDSMLGERSYSGGDLPESVLDEVEFTLENEQNKYFRIYFSVIEDAEKFQIRLKSKLNILFDLQEESIQDWNAEWKKHYEPIWVDDELEIIPAWDKDIQSNALNKLLIYPGMGFGTGSHETTFLCLQAFIRYKKEISLNLESSNKKCLDFGCGSGILGLSVLLFDDAYQVDLYDIDKEALHNCTQNIELNDMQEHKINLLLPANRDQINGAYDIVFANILQNVLEIEKETIINSVATNGLLILSGLLQGQETEIINSYLAHSDALDVVSIDKKNDWVCVTLKKK